MYSRNNIEWENNSRDKQISTRTSKTSKGLDQNIHLSFEREYVLMNRLIELVIDLSTLYSGINLYANNICTVYKILSGKITHVTKNYQPILPKLDITY